MGANFCPGCGLPQDPSNLFCPKCGRDLSAVNTETVAASPVVAPAAATAPPPKPRSADIIPPHLLIQMKAEEDALLRKSRQRGIIGCAVFMLLFVTGVYLIGLFYTGG